MEKETLRYIQEYFSQSLKDTIIRTGKPGPVDMRFSDLRYKKKICHRYLMEQKTAVLFMDAKDTTANHQLYNMAEEREDNYTRVLFSCVKEAMQERGLHCIIHAAVDECSVIYDQTSQLRLVYGETGQQEHITQLILQDILKRLWKVYPNNYLRGCIHYIEQEEIGRYIIYRQAVAELVGTTWFCKEKGYPKHIYASSSVAKMKKAIEKNGHTIPEILTKGILEKI